MINTPILKRSAYLTATVFALVLASGCFTEAMAQRDPFKKPGWATPRQVGPPKVGAAPKTSSAPKIPVNYGPPVIEARIEYFKKIREAAVANGSEPPKVTSVLTLSEMAVTGIFKTPRGYAAMVEATPIKLSYTIYPGEKFFDGQLVAVEENRLVFRKVTKVGEGKFVASVENKPLQQYTTKAQIEGTAPSQPSEKPVETAAVKTDATAAETQPKTDSKQFISPLDEMNTTPTAPADEKSDSKKPAKKPVKLARNTGVK